MYTQVLLLNTDYAPLQIIDWRRAVGLMLNQRASLVTDYVDRQIRSAHLSLPSPAVLVLKRYVRFQPRIRFSRANVLARDGYRCGYCGVRPVTAAGQPRMDILTIDHVIPRAQARGGRVQLSGGRSLPVSCWQNTVTACRSCNFEKGARTPEQAGFTLQVTPRRPHPWDILKIHLGRGRLPREWVQFIPEGL